MSESWMMDIRWAGMTAEQRAAQVQRVEEEKVTVVTWTPGKNSSLKREFVSWADAKHMMAWPTPGTRTILVEKGHKPFVAKTRKGKVLWVVSAPDIGRARALLRDALYTKAFRVFQV